MLSCLRRLAISPLKFGPDQGTFRRQELLEMMQRAGMPEPTLHGGVAACGLNGLDQVEGVGRLDADRFGQRGDRLGSEIAANGMGLPV